MLRELSKFARFQIDGVCLEVRPLKKKDGQTVWAHALTIATLGEKFEATLEADPANAALLARLGPGLEASFLGSLQANGYSVRLALSDVRPKAVKESARQPAAASA